MTALDGDAMRAGWAEAAARDPVRERIDALFDRCDDTTIGIYFDALEAVLQLCDGDGLCAADGVCSARPPRSCPAGLVREAIAVALSGNTDG